MLIAALHTTSVLLILPSLSQKRFRLNRLLPLPLRVGKEGRYVGSKKIMRIRMSIQRQIIRCRLAVLMGSTENHPSSAPKNNTSCFLILLDLLDWQPGR